MSELRPLTANDIKDTLFHPRRFREGYAVHEVDELLDDVEMNIAQWQRVGNEITDLWGYLSLTPQRYTKAQIEERLKKIIDMMPVKPGE